MIGAYPKGYAPVFLSKGKIMNALAYLEMLLLKEDSSYTSSQLAELLLLQLLMEVEAGIKTH